VELQVGQRDGTLHLSDTDCAGRGGDDDIRRVPAPATTDDKPPGNHEDHELRLEY